MTLTAGRVALGVVAFAVPMVGTAALAQLDEPGSGEHVDKPFFTYGLAAGLGASGLGSGIHEATRFTTAGNALRLAGAGALVGSFLGASLNS